MSDLISEQSKDKPISEVRSEVDRELRNYPDELMKNSMREWRVFLRVEPHQITQELVINWLKADEALYRERATQGLSGEEVSPLAIADYRNWERVSEALSGVTADGSVSKTIGFLRSEAVGWGKAASEERKQISEGGPFKKNFIKEMKVKQDQVKAWESVKERLIIGAGLFENSPKFVPVEKSASE